MARSGRTDGTMRLSLPPQACDCHVELTAAAEPLPDEAPPQAGLPELRALQKRLGLARAVLVQPACFGTDNTAMLQALALHRNVLRGVAAVAADLADEALERFAHTGVRGLRLGAEAADDPHGIEALAVRAEPLRLHLQLGLDAAALRRLAPLLAELPVEIAIEAMGRPDPAAGPGQPGFRVLLKLVQSGRCWVNLAGAPYSRPFVDALIQADPTRLLWGSGWPVAAASPPESLGQFALLVPDERLRHLILVENPARLYRFGE